MKKIVLLCITSIILASIPVSANALTMTTSVSPTGREWTSNTARCATRKGSTTTTYTRNAATCVFGQNYSFNNQFTNGALTGIFLDQKIDMKKGYYYSFYLSAQNTSFYNPGEIGGNIPPLLVTPATNSNFTLMEITEITDTTGPKLYENWAVEDSSQGQGSYSEMMTFSFVYQITLQALNDTEDYVGLGSNNLDTWLFTEPNGYLNYATTITISKVQELKPEGISEINNQQQQAGEQAQSDGQQGANTSETDTTQGTQSLLSAITGFVGIISNAKPTNCRITGDMGALDLGTLDFCQDNPPAIITTIGTLILIGITIPLVIWVVKKIISMFRSFTNG